MKITQISLALFAMALVGCGAKTETASTAPITVGDSIAPTAPTTAPAIASDQMSDTKTDAPAAAETAGNADNYRVRGQIVEVMPATENGQASVMVKHEDIPGFMKAMQMRMPLANSVDTTKIKPGDKIAFDMNKGNTEISNIEALPASTELKLSE